MLSQLKDLHQSLRNTVFKQLGAKKVVEDSISSTKLRLIEIATNTDNLIKASVFLQTLSDTTRQQIVDRISSIVTDALQKIKDPDLEFKMKLSTERNQVDVKFVVVNKKTEQEYDILNSCGGSIADIVTFPLKVALLLKWEPTLSRVLILDESFKFVSVADQEALGEFVRQISEKLNLQTILVTHSPTLTSKAHRVFEVTQNNRLSKVEEMPA